MSIHGKAMAFFEACDGGKGWESCKGWCHEDATFSCQADALSGVTTLAAYTDWMQGLLGPIPDGHYDLKAVGVDEHRHAVTIAAVFKGTHTGDGGPVAPTGKPVATDYVYIIAFENEQIRHMTKVWNDAPALRALGWA